MPPKKTPRMKIAMIAMQKKIPIGLIQPPPVLRVQAGFTL
jgi:hypothetical protein